MEILLAVILVLFLLVVFVHLCTSDSFKQFAARVGGEAVCWGFIYVVLHFLIKYW